MKFVIFTCIFFVSQFYLYSMQIGGILTSDTVLTADNSPYTVIEDLQVPKGITLSIEEGVELQFMLGKTLVVGGELKALGSFNKPITFTAYKFQKDTAWGGILFLDDAVSYDTLNNTGSCLRNCIIEYTTENLKSDPHGHSIGTAIQCLKTSILIDSCEIRNFKHGAFYLDYGGIITNSSIHDGYNYALDNFGDGGRGKYVFFRGNEVFNIWDPWDSKTSRTIRTGIGTFENNVFHDNRTGIIISVSSNCIVRKNWFLNNKQSIAVYLGGGDGHNISANCFENNNINIINICERYPFVKNNCFRNFIKYNIAAIDWWDASLPNTYYDCLMNKYPATIDFSGNFFYNLTEEQIQASIFDSKKDIQNRFTVEFKPVSTVNNCTEYPQSTEDLTQNDFYIAPNPASDYIIINPVHYFGNIEIYNSYGEKVLETEFREQIDVSFLPQGIYFLKTKIDRELCIKKFAVLR